MFVSHLMRILGNELDSSGGATLTAEPSLHPHILYFIYLMVCGMNVLHVCAHVHRGQRSMSYFFLKGSGPGILLSSTPGQHAGNPTHATI